MFDKLVWKNDRMLLGDLVFRLQHYKNEDWDLGNDCFIFYKIKPLVDQYARFFDSKVDFRARNILELGLWEGGSTAFWFECFSPKKYVGIDIAKKQDSEYFRNYLRQRGLTDCIKTYWEVSQEDTEKLQKIVSDEFGDSLDLVIDDASHLYKPTKKSFETLFPLLRPGGIYIIEDWAWGHWEQFQLPNDEWNRDAELTNLVFELVQATGTSKQLIANLTVFEGFVVIERGDLDMSTFSEFKLHDHIYRRTKGQTHNDSLGEQLTKLFRNIIPWPIQKIFYRLTRKVDKL